MTDKSEDMVETNLSEPDDDYKVGYRRPPRQWQFKKGRSGNRWGRPISKPTANDMILAMAEDKVSVLEGGKMKKMNKLSIAFSQMSLKAANGDFKQIKATFEMMQKMEKKCRGQPIPW